eukprot:m.173440 g.173440  ORF g.173440 m.173440 type:complete len:249 (+) comp25248_c0_seq3:148-894(+)
MLLFQCYKVQPIRSYMKHFTKFLDVCSPQLRKMRENPTDLAPHANPELTLAEFAAQPYGLPSCIPGVSNPDWFAEQLEMRPAKTCRRSGDVRPRGSIIPCGKSDLVDMKLQAFGYKLVGTTTYETNPTNYQTFDSILTMRETKILNFANISRWAPHVELSNIETLCANEQNFDNWVSVLAQKYSLSKNSISTRKANGFCPWDQTQSFYLHADDPAHLAAMGGKETIALINRYLQPSIEALAGYSLVGR